jgi:hypothetical protein
MTYVDNDGSRSFTSGDTPAGGGVSVRLVYGASMGNFAASLLVDVHTGRWELRAVPPGTYRVAWGAPLRDPADLARTIPRATSYQVTDRESAFGPNQFVTVNDSQRILNIDFGMPKQAPVVGASLPSTGRGGVSHSSVGLAITAAALALAGAGAALLARRRRT